MNQSSADRKQEILGLLQTRQAISTPEIMEALKGKFSLATIKRTIQELLKEQLIATSGKGKATRYSLSFHYGLIRPIDMGAYFQKEIDEREIFDSYQPTLIRNLETASLFSRKEQEQLQGLQRAYRENTAKLSLTDFKNEMERVAIDLSWKSSQIEGNTYSLLETEKLLKDQETAAGKTKDEAIMLLNHKEAIDFIVEHPDYVNPLNPRNIEDIHSILVRELSIDRNVRNHRVGITGTNYRPLDNGFQIEEALRDMCKTINSQEDVFAKALLSLLLLSYIQPFSDGNKRTARIISNALLLNYQHCPISFRTVDSIEYKKAMLVFYEQNNIFPFKKIFISQYEFAVKTYF